MNVIKCVIKVTCLARTFILSKKIMCVQVRPVVIDMALTIPGIPGKHLEKQIISLYSWTIP